MNPSDIVRGYRAASNAARRFGTAFIVSEWRLQDCGMSQEVIDAIFREIDLVDQMEAMFRARMITLDAPTNDAEGE